MLPFNEEFQTGESKITQIRLSVLLNNGTLLSLTEDHVMLGGLTRDSSTTVDGAFTVGAAVTGKLTVVLDNSDQSLSKYDFRAAVITASLGGQLSDGNYELIQIGIYTVDEYTYDGSVITLTAYDNFHKFDLSCSESSVTFPCTTTQLITQACSLAGVTLANTSIPNGSYSVTKQPESWDTMTWHDVVSYYAQIGCCYARILPNGKLFFAWYETNSLPGDQYDGGTFDTTTTPYSDGASLDGGDFNYAETVSVDGGTFGDREDVTIIGSTFDLTVDTDDVLITGVTVSLDPTNNINATDDTEVYEKTLGTSGYVIRIENNPLIETTANADAVCAFLYDYLVGMRFRPLNASIPENPALEAGDVALVIDRLNNTYTCFLSHVSYTTGAATSMSCDAESSMQNLKARYSEAQKTRALAQRTFEKSISDAEAAMQTIMSAIATTMGLYRYTESDGQGGTIYVYGNENTLASSNIRWKFSAGALMVSSDYGGTWNGALTAEGTLVLQEIYAVKVNADNILTGTLTIGGTSGNKNGSLIIKDASGNVIGTFNKDGISVKGNIQSGSSITGATIAGGTVTGTVINSSELRSLRDGNYPQAVYINNGNIWAGGYKSGLLDLNHLCNISASGIQMGNGIIVPDNNTWAPTSISGASLEWNGSDSYYVNSLTLSGINIAPNMFYIFMPVEIGGGGWNYSLTVHGSLTVSSTKSRVVKTTDNDRLAYCYEMASPVFGDMGGAVIGEDGSVIVDIDALFQDFISDRTEYYVFLQNEGMGESYISEKHPTYFVISGTPGLKVAWELKGRQIDYNYQRLEVYGNEENINDNYDYAEQAFRDVMDFLDTSAQEVTT